MARYSCLIWRGVALFSFKVFVSTSRFGGVISTPSFTSSGKTDRKMDKTGKIKTFSFVSLDGYAAKMGGSIDWLTDYPRPSSDRDYGFGGFAETVGCAVLNGIYYAMLQATDIWPPRGIRTKVLLPDYSVLTPGRMPDFVLLRPESGFGYVEAVEAIRRETSGDIWLAGDRELLSQFMERGLIDEITVNVVPVILGNGYTLFSRNRMEQYWDMVCFQCFDNGVMQMRYVPRT